MSSCPPEATLVPFINGTDYSLACAVPASTRSDVLDAFDKCCRMSFGARTIYDDSNCFAYCELYTPGGIIDDDIIPTCMTAKLATASPPVDFPAVGLECLIDNSGGSTSASASASTSALVSPTGETTSATIVSTSSSAAFVSVSPSGVATASATSFTVVFTTSSVASASKIPTISSTKTPTFISTTLALNPTSNPPYAYANSTSIASKPTSTASNYIPVASPSGPHPSFVLPTGKASSVKSGSDAMSLGAMAVFGLAVFGLFV